MLVSWVLPTAIDTLVVMVALARLGAVQNPIIPVYREREIGHILDEAQVDAMIVVPEWRGVDFLSMCTGLAASRGGLPVLSFPALMDPESEASLPVLNESGETMGTCRRRNGSSTPPARRGSPRAVGTRMARSPPRRPAWSITWP